MTVVDDALKVSPLGHGVERLRETHVLVGMFLFVAFVWGFAFIAHIALSGQSEGFDTALLLSMRTEGDLSNPIGPRWLEEIGRDFTALGGNAILVSFTLFTFFYTLLRNKPKVAMVLLVSALGALVLSTLMKMGFDRARPDLVPHGSVVYTKSFPSGHSMLSASIYLTLGALLANLQSRRLLKVYIMFIACLLTFAVGVSRVYLGVHWPTDVFAGWIAGAVWAMACWLIAKKLDVIK